VLVLGSGLATARQVKFGANSAHFSVDSDAQLTAVSPPSDTLGPVAVAVTTDGGTASGPLFTYTAGEGNAVAPAAAPTGQRQQ
jgi:IPT/TIG domain